MFSALFDGLSFVFVLPVLLAGLAALVGLVALVQLLPGRLRRVFNYEALGVIHRMYPDVFPAPRVRS